MRFDEAFDGWEKEAAARGKGPTKPQAHKLRREAADMAGMQRAALSRQFPEVDPQASRPLFYRAELSDDELILLTEWLDRRWQEMQDVSDRAARRRDVLQAAADELALQLRTDVWTVVPFACIDIDLVIGRELGELKGRAGDPRFPTDEEVICKFRFRVQLRLFFDTTPGRQWLVNELMRHTAGAAVARAWTEVRGVSGAAESDVVMDTPSRVEVPERLENPESMGRHPWSSLCLWLLPNGPVAARPLPVELAEAIKRRTEGGVLADVITGEIRRSTYPAGLIDRQWRCAWLLSVLLLTATWNQDRTNQAATATLADCGYGIRGAVAAVRCVDQTTAGSSVPRPGRLDRMRHAAAIQHRWPNTTEGNEDTDGWWREVAAVAFAGADAYRCAVPWATALELSAVTPVGAVMRERFGRGEANRAHRFGEVNVELLCQQTVKLAGRKVWQLLLKQDQAPDGNLSYGSAKQWNSLLQKHVNLLAKTVAGEYAARRVPQDSLDVAPDLVAAPDAAEPDGAVKSDDGAVAFGALHAAASAHDELRPLVAVREGAATASALARLTMEWKRKRVDFASASAVTTRLRWLRLFEEWIRGQHDVAEDLARGTLKGVDDPLRNLLHHFVQTGMHRPSKSLAPTDDPVEMRSMMRTLERDSLNLYRLVETMVSDVYKDATTDGS